MVTKDPHKSHKKKEMIRNKKEILTDHKKEEILTDKKIFTQKKR